MRIPLSWLRDFIATPWGSKELGSRLTMSGFELEAVESAAPPFSGVVVADIIEAAKHPQAEKLQVCKVKAADGEVVQIVCGAANARAGLRTALATVGAKLPGDKSITAAKLRGVESFGMLCSAKELGLADTSEGIIELPADAPVGQDLRAYMQLDDEVLELNVTPNRGDAMSVLGIAREVGALARRPAAGEAAGAAKQVAEALKDTIPVKLSAPAGCPKLACRVVRGIDNTRPSPLWLRERLRRAGVRPISPVVDVTQYVMLELGQPMHAYDLGKLKGGLEARQATGGEKITLLDGKEIELAADVLVIADDEGAVGMAGVMGGARTMCSADTVDILFEAAFFAPAAIAGRGRRYGLVTDAGQRFERGVDPAHQERAIARATGLLLEIAGGQAGPTHVVQDEDKLPRRLEVALRRDRIRKLLGASIADNDVKLTLESLGMRVLASDSGWLVTPPPHRFDISIEADLIEELARVVGFEAIPEADAIWTQKVRPLAEEAPVESQALEILAGGKPGAGNPRYARLPGSHHLRLRRSRAAGAHLPRCEDTGVVERDFGGDVRHARFAVAGPDQGRARESAPPAGSHPPVRTWRAFQRRWRNRFDRGHCARHAPAGAVGNQGHGHRFPRREERCGGAVRAK
ncbi:MAG: pheT, partial [Steroidobacteraceae bacterium]|nr:pheT [Steroidobacteraceae bacterium]